MPRAGVKTTKAIPEQAPFCRALRYAATSCNSCEEPRISTLRPAGVIAKNRRAWRQGECDQMIDRQAADFGWVGRGRAQGLEDFPLVQRQFGVEFVAHGVPLSPSSMACDLASGDEFGATGPSQEFDLCGHTVTSSCRWNVSIFSNHPPIETYYLPHIAFSSELDTRLREERIEIITLELRFSFDQNRSSIEY